MRQPHTLLLTVTYPLNEDDKQRVAKAVASALRAVDDRNAIAIQAPFFVKIETRTVDEYLEAIR
jgi:hypothetical protein